MFEVAASLRTDMKVNNADGPYQQHKGDFRFRFSLVYASLDDVLPQVEELCLLAARGDSKEQRGEAARQLQQMIKVGAGRLVGSAGTVDVGAAKHWRNRHGWLHASNVGAEDGLIQIRRRLSV